MIIVEHLAITSLSSLPLSPRFDTSLNVIASDPFCQRTEALELRGGLLECSAPSLREEDEDEDGAEEADTPVHEEGGGEPQAALDVPEALGDDEPAQVGGEVGDGVGVAPGPHRQDLRGHHPGQAAQAQVESDREAHQKRERKPGIAVQITRGSGSSQLSIFLSDVIIKVTSGVIVTVESIIMFT